MSNNVFDYLCRLSDLVRERGAPAPQLKELEKDWHGAAFDVLGTRTHTLGDPNAACIECNGQLFSHVG